MTWSDKFSVGVPMIDAQHQALFNAIDRIYSILEDHDLERDRRVSKDAVFFLRRHAIRHFADEEAYMRSIGDGTYRLHKAQHEAILDELEKKEQAFVDSGYSPDAIRQLLGTLLSWLTYHTLEVDRLIGKSLTVPAPSTPAAALERAAAQVFTDLLQISPELVDPAYEGTLYGSGLFCAVTGSVASEPFSFLYGADQQVMEQAVGKLLGTPVTQTDELVRSAFEELCRLLSIHFIKGYRNGSFFRIDRSRVAAQEELASMLPASDPVCSTLFNEPYGSFFIRIW